MHGFGGGDWVRMHDVRIVGCDGDGLQENERKVEVQNGGEHVRARWDW